MLYRTRKQKFVHGDPLDQWLGYFWTTDPRRWLGDTEICIRYSNLYGLEEFAKTAATQLVAENTDPEYVAGPAWQGKVYNELDQIVFSLPSESQGFPVPGEPAYVARLEKKLDDILTILISK